MVGVGGVVAEARPAGFSNAAFNLINSNKEVNGTDKCEERKIIGSEYLQMSVQF